LSSSEATKRWTTGLSPSSNATNGSRVRTGASTSWAVFDIRFETVIAMQAPSTPAMPVTCSHQKASEYPPPVSGSKPVLASSTSDSDAPRLAGWLPRS
jgi:hypothetical protein